ncbi:hypothetical protein [Spirochaeta isovalerica]|uniref:Uncharacterized protein n=1 Tax=Spirochaeta isovalerica TaxID=150 RepID=A0A841RCC3_9SPIO|nr:hypothetical protein [Spirochaeta isovalerica]MBB6480650.1 hypothetical protein [Spirochaeta isovalerica]
MVKTHHSIETIFLLIILTVLSSIAALFPLWGNGILTVALPIYLLITGKQMVPFERIKISTLLIGRVLTFLTALLVVPGTLLVKSIVVLLYINILEALISDLKKKSYFNVLSGAALLLTTHILFSTEWVTPVISESYKIVHIGYYISTNAGLIPWILAYTIWNWNFVIFEFPKSIGRYHLAILATPILFSLITLNPGFWLLLRGSSLTIGGVIQISYKDKLITKLDHDYYSNLIDRVKSRTIQIILMIITIALCISALLFSVLY